MFDNWTKDLKGGWAHVKEIANTRLIVYTHHSMEKRANLGVFDVSRKGRVQQIYSFEEVHGCKIIVTVLFINNLTL